jgi:hypothetical protein
VHLRSVALGGVEREPAESAADIEQALARLEAELATDVIELALLRGVEVFFEVGEVGARVDEPAVEEGGEELRSAVVVVRDGGAVALPRMQRSPVGGRCAPRSRPLAGSASRRTASRRRSPAPRSRMRSESASETTASTSPSTSKSPCT